MDLFVNKCMFPHFGFSFQKQKSTLISASSEANGSLFPFHRRLGSGEGVLRLHTLRLWLGFVEQRERGTFSKLAGVELGKEERYKARAHAPASCHGWAGRPCKGL